MTEDVAVAQDRLANTDLFTQRDSEREREGEGQRGRDRECASERVGSVGE